jgi:hypothetical protein
VNRGTLRLAVVLAAGMSLAAGCDRSDPPVPNGPTAAGRATTATPAATHDKATSACALLTPADIAAVTGLTGYAVDSRQSADSHCAMIKSSKGGIPQGVLAVSVVTQAAKEIYLKGEREARAAAPAISFEEVTDLGDRSNIVGGVSITVLTGDTLLMINTSFDGLPEQNTKLKQLAEIALSRL